MAGAASLGAVHAASLGLCVPPPSGRACRLPRAVRAASLVFIMWQERALQEQTDAHLMALQTGHEPPENL